jgi:acyl dehydratase
MTYATEIIERRRQAKAAEAFPWNAPFEQLAVGMSFTTPPRAVTADDVAAFAQLTGDHHPQHTDAAWASASPFGERIAHGLLVLSLAAGLVPFDPRRAIALRRVEEATFKRPVRFGDDLHVEGRIAGVRPLGGEAGLVALAWSVVNQDGRAVCRARVEVLWRRDDAFMAIPL